LGPSLCNGKWGEASIDKRLGMFMIDETLLSCFDSFTSWIVVDKKIDLWPFFIQMDPQKECKLVPFFLNHKSLQEDDLRNLVISLWRLVNCDWADI
jgi:hypothetical protein